MQPSVEPKTTSLRDALLDLRPVFTDENRTKCANCREIFASRYREFFENKDSKIANEIFPSKRAAKSSFVCASCSARYKTNEKKRHLMEVRRDRDEALELKTPKLHFLQFPSRSGSSVLHVPVHVLNGAFVSSSEFFNSSKTADQLA